MRNGGTRLHNSFSTVHSNEILTKIVNEYCLLQVRCISLLRQAFFGSKSEEAGIIN